ncbi:MAG TPA: serine hydrolase domain-containing protein [Solirubrobacteraceae bacterium]|jgi:D-alanyl-D-alanine carboxypeptidase|nr:serine hydrolase domain-containing protein [Solirubrobacteraceae bacterium]
MFSTKTIAAAAAAASIGATLVPTLAEAGGPTPDATTPALQRALNATVNARVPGAVLFARDGNRTVQVASGYADAARRTRMRASDRFRIGNVTSSFVATVVLQLVGEGRLGLDDSVESRLPGAIPTGATITIRDLLDMRSGLFDYLADGDTTVVDRLLAGDWAYRWTPSELVAITNAHPPLRAPDVAWSFCNTCYVLLGQIVERTTGHGLADELRARVFAPAGLTSTSFDGEPQIAGPHAQGYEQFEQGQLTDVTAISPSYAWAAGAIVSTVGDVARFYRALYRGRLLRADLVSALQATQPMGPELEGWGYGFGVIEKPMGCGSGFGHDASAFGYLAYAYSSSDGNRQSVILANAGDTTMDHEDNGALQQLVARAYCGG